MIQWFTGRQWHVDLGLVSTACALALVAGIRFSPVHKRLRPVALAAALSLVLAYIIGPLDSSAFIGAAVALISFQQAKVSTSGLAQMTFVATCICSFVGVWATVPDTETALIACAVFAPVLIALRSTVRNDTTDNLFVLGCLLVAAGVGAAGRHGAIAGAALVGSSQSGWLVASTMRRRSPLQSITASSAAIVSLALHLGIAVIASRVVSPQPQPDWTILAPGCVAITLLQGVLASRVSAAR